MFQHDVITVVGGGFGRDLHMEVESFIYIIIPAISQAITSRVYERHHSFERYLGIRIVIFQTTIVVSEIYNQLLMQQES